MTRLRDLVRQEGLPVGQLPGWLERIVTIGIVSTDPRIIRRQKITNVASFAGVANSVVRLVVNAMYDIEHYVLVQSIVVALCVTALLVPLLHRWGDNVGATVLVIWFISAVIFVVFLFGTASQVQVYFVLAAVIPFLFGLENWRTWLFWVAAVFVALFSMLNLGPTEGFVLTADSELRVFLSRQALVNTIIINTIVILYALVLLHRAEAELERQRMRAESLVNVVLPDTVARRLRDGQEPRIADRIDGVTLLFADLVGFTAVAHTEEPERVVAYLDEFVRTFDLMCETFEVEKIKTIGDAYMAAGGLHGRSRESATAVGRLALEMLKVQERRPMLGGRKLQLRIGIHCGTTIAGIIGDTRISYDLWGDAVNIASRLQSQGVPGRIQVSDDYRALVGDCFEFEDRGLTELRGIGAARTHFLVAERGVSG